MTTALRYLHEECFILHSDLHVRNWFLKGDGQLVLGDFGSSKQLGGPDGEVPVGTRPHYFVGFSAPEM